MDGPAQPFFLLEERAAFIHRDPHRLVEAASMSTFAAAMPDTVLTPLRCLPLAPTATELAANLVPAEMRGYHLYKSAISLRICTKPDIWWMAKESHRLRSNPAKRCPPATLTTSNTGGH